MAESARDLHQGSASVLDTTRAMRDAVEENAAGANQLAGSAQSLSDQVEKLHGLLSRFTLGGGKPGDRRRERESAAETKTTRIR